MEKQEYLSLSLTSEVFNMVLEAIHNKFKEKHNLHNLPKASQLYGYGNFDESKSSLKNDFEDISSDFVNGKYLYDKTREFHKGKPVIKLNKYYKTLILLYLGYNDIQEFIDKHQLNSEETEKQLSLIYDKNTQKTYYYLNYYFGEDNTIIKGQTVISNNWKKIQHTYIYRQEDGSVKEHYNFGNIIRREDTIHINTKTLLDGKLVEGASEVYYIGHIEPSNVSYLIGSYCAYDIYTNTVAGKIILEKCNSKEEMIEKSKNENIPPYIAQEIRNKRIINNSIVPKNHLELSENSPYASIYDSIPGKYQLTFKFSNGNVEKLDFKILKNNFRIIPLTENVYFEKDKIDLLNKGSVIHFSFEFAGIIALDKVDIYFKTYFLREGNENPDGVYSGIDKEGKLVSDSLSIIFEHDRA